MQKRKRGRKMSQFDKTMNMLDKNVILYCVTQLWGDNNELVGYAIWLDVGHFEFDLDGNLFNIVDY
jgi:hypothetical protein